MILPTDSLVGFALRVYFGVNLLHEINTAVRKALQPSIRYFSALLRLRRSPQTG
jgi:hypothetical protein